MTNENRFSPTVKQNHSQLPKDSQPKRKPNLSPTPPSDWLFSDIRAKNLLHLFSIRLSLSQTKRPDTYIFYRSTKIKVSMRLSLSIFLFMAQHTSVRWYWSVRWFSHEHRANAKSGKRVRRERNLVTTLPIALLLDSSRSLPSYSRGNYLNRCRCVCDLILLKLSTQNTNTWECVRQPHTNTTKKCLMKPEIFVNWIADYVYLVADYMYLVDLRV